MKTSLKISALLLAVALVCCPVYFHFLNAQPKAAAEGGGIKWMSLTDAEKLNMGPKKKKIFMDIYTDWCGWCKRLDATTYKDPKVVKYVNDNFYAVKLDAETKDDITFKGIKYSYDPNYKVNMVSPKFMQGSNGYPTLTYLDEDFRVVRVAPGYVDVASILSQLKYVGENYYLNMSYDQYNNKMAGGAGKTAN